MIREIQIYAGEVKQAVRREEIARRVQHTHWQRPTDGVLKINCDASFQPLS
jgi:hypothetical protein